LKKNPYRCPLALLHACTPLRLLSCQSLLLLACAQTRLPFIAL
jgi:hypothetical protein